MAEADCDAETICRKISDVAGRVETSFLIDRLDYIFKGGRCSLATALGANILHLRTCVEVNGGIIAGDKNNNGAPSKTCVETIRTGWKAGTILYRRGIFINIRGLRRRRKPP